MGIGDKFQQETKYHRNEMPEDEPGSETKPELYKTYPSSQKIELPRTGMVKNITFDEILNSRKSTRSYTKEPVTMEFLSFLLWASSGIQRVEKNREFRTAPSAGARYPIETYIVVNNIEDLEPGIYHYNIREHFLELLKEGRFGEKLSEAALGQYMCAEAPVVFVWTAIFDRMKWVYKQRAYRYIYMDAGHIAENLALAAVSLELQTCQIAALYDDEASDLLEVDKETESVIYMSTVGYPAK
jgi:SagB-type dehydrogenase family enzyme